jgi:CelD/BcsL family acetyltransferase involved in cellulose biosynthesis
MVLGQAMAEVTPTYRINAHTSFEEVPRETWDRLHAASLDSSVFQAYGWVTAWWECCAPTAAELCLLTAEADGNVVAIAPLYLQKPVGDSDRCELRFLGGYHNDYQCYLVHPLHAEVFTDLHRYVLARLPAHEYKLMELSRSSSLNHWLVRHGQRVVRYDATPCPMLRLDIAQDLGLYLDKKSVRRKHNKLSSLGFVEVDHIVDGAAIRAAIPDLFEQHVRRWRNTPYPSLFQDETNREFFLRLIDSLPVGVAVFTRIRIEEHAIACHLGFRSGRDLLWYKPAYDPDYAQCSPGELMITELIRYARNEGYRALDFTRGDEPFKRRFCNTLNWNDSFVMYRSHTNYWMRRAERSVRRAYRHLRERAALR